MLNQTKEIYIYPKVEQDFRGRMERMPLIIPSDLDFNFRYEHPLTAAQEREEVMDLRAQRKADKAARKAFAIKKHAERAAAHQAECAARGKQLAALQEVLAPFFKAARLFTPC